MNDRPTATAWEPQPGFQSAFVNCPVFEIFGGGARGGGKSDAVLGDWAIHASEYGKDAIGLMVRRSRTELVELFERGREIYTKIGANVTYNPMRVVFPNGARLTFAYLERDADAESYQGFSLTRLYVEECGNFPSPRPNYEADGDAAEWCGCAGWHPSYRQPRRSRPTLDKGQAVDPAPLGWKVITDPITGLQRIFLPSRVTDNKYLGADYVQRLKASGSPELVRAWLYGDWQVVAGSFFPEFSMDRHVIAPRTLPEHWARFRSFDWGSARPFSVGWWAVSDGSMPDIPRGCLVRYREWYGMKPGEPNVGLRMTAEEVARGIRLREEDDPSPLVGVADPAIFAEDGGPSIAQRMILQGVVFRPADNKRVPGRGAMGGWDQVRSRLIGDADGQPMLLMFSTCRDLIRTLPALQHDATRPEDVDCWVGGTLVATPSGDRPIEAIAPGDLVETPIGPRPVLRSYLSGASATIRVTLSDGRVLEGTPHHKIYVACHGLVALSDLKCHMIPQERIIWSKWLNTAVSCIAAMKGVSTTTRPARSWAARAARAFIVKSGSMLAETFLPVGTFTTEMATTTTTTSPILNASPAVFTADSTWSIGLAQAVTLDNRSRSGVALGKANGPFAETLPRCWLTRQSGNVRADIVAVLLQRDILRRLSAVPRVLKLCRTLHARFAGSRSAANHTAPSGCAPVHIVAVGRSGERTLVYNLTVDDAHLFYANGVLSSNTESEDHSSDECRYACMSRPFVQDMKREPVVDSWSRAFQRADRDGEPNGWRVA